MTQNDTNIEFLFKTFGRSDGGPWLSKLNVRPFRCSLNIANILCHQIFVKKDDRSIANFNFKNFKISNILNISDIFTRIT